MLDTAVRMGGFHPDVVVESSLPDLIMVFSMPFVRGMPKLSDKRGRKAVVVPSTFIATGVFLASDGAAAITGQVIYVDGGYQIMGM